MFTCFDLLAIRIQLQKTCFPLAFFLGLWMSLNVSVLAQESSPQTPPPKEEDFSLKQRLTGSLTIDIYSDYYFRGILQENQGVIVQPYLDLTLNLLKTETTALQSLDLVFGTWNSLHSGPSGTGGETTDPRMWYESDFYAGISLDFLEYLNTTVSYYAYASPNDTFETSQELLFKLSFNDEALWGDWFGGIQPAMVLAVELENTAFGKEEGVYLGLMFEPEIFSYEKDAFSFSLTLPISFGFSLSDYYEDIDGKNDDFFGYVDVGINGSIPLGFIHSSLENWEISGGVHGMYLESDQLKAANNDHDFEVICDVGLTITF
jgi:hypothetical protein